MVKEKIKIKQITVYREIYKVASNLVQIACLSNHICLNIKIELKDTII